MKRISLLFILLLFLFAGCVKEPAEAAASPEPIPTLSYTESEAVVRYIEKYSSAVVFSGKTADYAGVHANYHFDPAIPDGQKDACVYWTEKLMERMRHKDVEELYILSGYGAVWQQEGAWYVGAEDFASADYAAKVITMACGAYANYGGVHGYAEYLAIGYGWQESRDYRLSLTDSPARDLGYLCFREEFVSPAEVEQNESIACVFAADCIAENGEEAYIELLKLSAEPETAGEFSRRLSRLYDSHGLDYTPTQLLFARSTDYYDYPVKCEYAEFFMPWEWVNDDVFSEEIIFAREFDPETGEGIHAELDRSLDELKTEWRAYLNELYGEYPTFRDER